MNGKAKGSGFERKIARELSLYLTAGKSKTELIRSVLSGGWSVGQRNGEAWRQVGDLAPNGPAGEEFRAHWAVECKHHRKISLYDFWTRSSKDSLVGWWNKLVQDAGDAHVKPMLIFRSNAMPIMVGMRPVDAPEQIFSKSAPFAHFPRHDVLVLQFGFITQNVRPESFLK